VRSTAKAGPRGFGGPPGPPQKRVLGHTPSLRSSAKQRVREEVWAKLEEARAALFPGARGRIPNFKGAAAAADRLGETAEWRNARVIKCNPDAPQRPVRLRALREGKLVFSYMLGVPKFRQ